MLRITNWFIQNVKGEKIMRIQYASDIHLELSDMSYGEHLAGFDGVNLLRDRSVYLRN